MKNMRKIQVQIVSIQVKECSLKYVLCSALYGVVIGHLLKEHSKKKRKKSRQIRFTGMVHNEK